MAITAAGVEQSGPCKRRFEDEKMPPEIDSSKGVRGLHQIPPDARVFLPTSIERSVWEYFSSKAEEKGADLSALLADVLKPDIEINEALK
jgi:hypothetical protein